jgi:hypothetical protein
MHGFLSEDMVQQVCTPSTGNENGRKTTYFSLVSVVDTESTYHPDMDADI